MSLSEWRSNGWLRPHRTSAEEISGLFSIVDRDLQDARTSDLSTDWQFGIAYNASLKLCMVLLQASGYRAEKTLQHFRTIASIVEVMGESKKEAAEYLEVCRVKRNTVEYDLAGVTSATESKELIDFSEELREEVLQWLRDNYPHLVPTRK